VTMKCVLEYQGANVGLQSPPGKQEVHKSQLGKHRMRLDTKSEAVVTPQVNARR
jgi:hypothetical protein